MKRLFRIPLNLITATSLLLFLATLMLWARSYWIGDQWYRESLERTDQILISRGRCQYLAVRPDPPFTTEMPGLLQPKHFTHERLDASRLDEAWISQGEGWSTLGFAYRHGSTDLHATFKFKYRAAAVPLWSAAIVTAALPGHWLFRSKRRRASRRRRAGLCPT